MKLPYGLKIEIERLARLLLAGTIDWEDALDQLEALLSKLDYKLYVSDLLRRHLRAQLRSWMASQLAAVEEDEENENQQLPFPDLKPWIEIAVGLKKHQNTMELSDWDAAVVMAQTKVTNAAGNLERIQAARDRAYADAAREAAVG